MRKSVCGGLTALTIGLLFLSFIAPARGQDANNEVSANNQFTLELYSKYSSEGGNIFFSPYSIFSALGMTYEGARGKTADEMRSVFHFSGNDALRRQSFLEINGRINKKDKKYTLRVANALWAQKEYTFLDDYFKLIDTYYGGKATNLDFIEKTEQSRITINSWVEEQTNGKIKGLIPSGSLNAMTRLVLTNAIYFKGTWLKQFKENDTMEADFMTGPSSTVKAKMMHLSGDEARFAYAETGFAQILELPYKGKELSMLIILPKGDYLKFVEESLNPAQISEWKKLLRNEEINLYLPKFKFKTKYFMAGDLKEMGMPAAFSSEADFSGMTGAKDLYISEVIHQAFVEVNEEGTEAAAATAVGMMAKGMPSPPKVFKADHPFIFLIQEKETGIILFAGRVSDPTK